MFERAEHSSSSGRHLVLMGLYNVDFIPLVGFLGLLGEYPITVTSVEALPPIFSPKIVND